MERDPVLQRLAAEIAGYESALDDLPVSPTVSPHEIRDHLSRYDFARPIPLDQLVGDVAGLLRRWSLHVNHPRYFGLFNPTVRRAGVVADALAALYNPQLAAWPHAPVANEIERHVLGSLMRAFGLDPGSGFANFTSGGQEANQTAVTAALTRAFPAFAEHGVRALEGQPTLYVSAEAHHSFLKIAHQSGIGREAVRHIAVDDRLRMDVEQLARQIEADRADGRLPFLIVGTAGTTAAGAIDPLPELDAVARREQLWFHVDAAWGGAAVLSPALRHHLAGIEQADSITCDAHKWLSVPVGAGMFFTRHREPILQAFRVEASSYVPPAVADTFDPYVTTIQWSRRFIGLKLFMTIAELGWQGMARLIEEQAAMGEFLRARLASSGWRLVADSPLAVVCFTHPEIESGRVAASEVVDRVVGGGQAWISQVRLRGSTIALRACITSHRTRPADIDILVDELEQAIRPR
ncbi:MAG TPA: aminotransferase class V-fold PLP-dependent enzyme [Candidatus Limnocylindria bacterium]|nr:aminotransferase class V-fold PLP-dependent enzyme [Candidatus Limnocylindria bacterium]